MSETPVKLEKKSQIGIFDDILFFKRNGWIFKNLAERFANKVGSNSSTTLVFVQM